MFQEMLYPYWWWMFWCIALVSRHLASIGKICFDQVFPVKEENIWSLTSCMCLIWIGKKKIVIITYIFILYWIFHKLLFFCLPELLITYLIPYWNFLQLLQLSRIMFKLQVLAWLWLSALKAALQCCLGYQKWVSHSSKDRLFDHEVTHTLMCVVNCFLFF